MNIGGTLIFFADRNPSVTGVELWQSNGTNLGTVMLKDFAAEAANIDGFEMLTIGGTAYFTLSTSAHGRELWKTDGTAAGTLIVSDLLPGSGSSEPRRLLDFNGTLFFTANDGAGQSGLWKTDGSATGTIFLKSMGSDGAGFEQRVVANDALYFGSYEPYHRTELWRYQENAFELVAIPGRRASAWLDLGYSHGTLYFVSNTEDTGKELWRLKPVLDLINLGSTVTQNSNDVITSAELTASEEGAAASEIQFTIVAFPTHGQLELVTDPGVAVTQFMQADIDANLLVYVHDGSEEHTDQFTFTSVNLGGAPGLTRDETDFLITVTPINNPHTGGVTINGTAEEDGILTVENTLADVDGVGSAPLSVVAGWCAGRQR